MTREELLENAGLDAYGLLDEYEAALYTRSFHHAPAAVQDEILQLQAQLVSDETFLTSEMPDPKLRDRVLDAVAVAIEQETAELEPLATIGRGRMAPIEIEPKPVVTQGGYYWRAAAFVLLASMVVVLYFMSDVMDKYNQLAVIALQNNTDAQLEKLIHPTAKDFIFDGSSQRVVFSATNAAADARAAMYIDENTQSGLLILDGLTASQQPIYSLHMRDSKGAWHDVESFGSNGRLSGVRIALESVASRLHNATWEVRDAAGAVLMTSI